MRHSFLSFLPALRQTILLWRRQTPPHRFPDPDSRRAQVKVQQFDPAKHFNKSKTLTLLVLWVLYDNVHRLMFSM